MMGDATGGTQADANHKKDVDESTRFIIEEHRKNGRTNERGIGGILTWTIDAREAGEIRKRNGVRTTMAQPCKGPQRGQNRLFVPRHHLAGSFDQRYERAQRLCDRKERVLQKLRRIWPLFGINFERLGKVIPERQRQLLWIRNRRCALSGNQIKP